MEKSYEKVVDYVQKQILDGVCRTGDKLPSEREMAQQLNVSRTSVREGLRILEQMGSPLLPAGFREIILREILKAH